MRTYLYDGSLEGFLTALALALESGGEGCAIARESGAGARKGGAAGEAGAAQGDLFAEYVNAGADPARAAKVRALVESRGSPESWLHLRRVHLAETPGAETAALEYVRLLAEKGPSADNMLADDRVKKVHDLSAKVAGEGFMFRGFVRFKELADGTLYSRIEPDHNVLPLLTGHFRARLGEFNWVIHDAGRGTAALYFRGRLVFARLDSARLDENAKEAEMRDLWKSFFNAVAIKERKNPKLQRQFVPLKYRKNLTEFE